MQYVRWTIEKSGRDGRRPSARTLRSSHVHVLKEGSDRFTLCGRDSWNGLSSRVFGNDKLKDQGVPMCSRCLAIDYP